MSTETIELLLCTDCAVWAANRDDSGAGDAWLAWFEAEGADALQDVVVGEFLGFVPRPCEVCQCAPGDAFEAVRFVG